MRDPYLYDDIDVIKNKLGIKDKDRLETAESDIVASKLLDVDKFADGKFDLKKLQSIHKHLFGDIYEWAGEPRKINIYKEEDVLSGLSVEYCSNDLIEKEAKNVISEMNKINWKKLSDYERVETISKLTAKLWQVHSFREGNTRTTITFVELFAKSKGIEIDRELLKNSPKYVRDSLVLASIGEYSEYEHLIKIIKDSILDSKTESKQKINNEKVDVVEKMLEKDPEALKIYKENKAQNSLNIKNVDLGLDR